MTFLPSIVEEAEGFLRQRAAALVDPRPNECLCCYLARMLDRYACDGTHRYAVHYRDAMAPRATALTTRLAELGACCCDCELFFNGYELAHDEGSLPSCLGVRRGSIRPCRRWLRIRRF
jgi:hypothetical protein